MTDEATHGSADGEADAPPAKGHPWTELADERHRLLRLAPLPTDRETGARPLRFAQLGTLERHSRELSLLRLSVRLPGQAVQPETNILEVWADHQLKELRFGPDSGLRTEPANRGLGRFLLGQAIAWAKVRWAHYQVEGGALAGRQVPSEDARKRRDHALRAQGFDVIYEDPLQLKARYAASRVSVLHDDWHGEKVQLVSPLEAGAMLQQADHTLAEQDARLRQQQERLARFGREDATLRFTIACLVALALFQAGLLIWIATR
jgi:hypothetical protein